MVGTYVGYTTVPYLMIALPMLFFCAFAFLPDTPQHLLRCDRVQAAEQAMRFYKNYAGDSTAAATVQAKAKAAARPQFAIDFERMKVAAEHSRNSESESFQWADLGTSTH